MQTLHIQDSTVRLTVNGDAGRIIAFDPQDVGFVERFYGLIAAFEAREQDYHARAAELDRDTATDAYGIPANTKARIALLRETCEFLRAQIDHVFGEGTSMAAFGPGMSLEVVSQFFEGVTPYIQQARQGATDKYLADTGGGVLK